MLNIANERIACFIKNVDWKYNPTDFEYKLNVESTTILKGKMSEVAEFGIDNESTFKRFKGNIERSSTNANRLIKRKSLDFKEETLFLKVISAGEANLYSYKDGLVTKFFFNVGSHPLSNSFISVILLTKKPMPPRTTSSDSNC